MVRRELVQATSCMSRPLVLLLPPGLPGGRRRSPITQRQRQEARCNDGAGGGPSMRDDPTESIFRS